MTSQLNVDIIVDKAGSGGTNVKVGNASTYVSDGGNATQNTVQGLAKALCYANADTSLRDSLNIASGTDNGVGDYTYSYTNNMNNVNFTCVVSTNYASLVTWDSSEHGTASFNIRSFTRADSLTASDNPQATTIHGDLA